MPISQSTLDESSPPFGNIDAVPPNVVAGDFTTLSYGRVSAMESSSPRLGARWLLIPNLASAIVLLLPLHSDETALEPLIEYSRQLMHGGAAWGGQTWEALITGPYLLAIPLAIWTARLSIVARPRAAEKWLAWSMTLASMMMTVLCLGFCVTTDPRDYALAIVGAVLLIVLGGIGITLLRRLRHAWPLALLAMTAVWAANATFTAMVVLSHRVIETGLMISLCVVAAQVAAAVVSVAVWRRSIAQ